MGVTVEDHDGNRYTIPEQATPMVLRLKSTDVLYIGLTRHEPRSVVESIREQIAGAGITNRVLIGTGPIEITVLRPEE